MRERYPQAPCTWPTGAGDGLGPLRVRQLRLLARRLLAGPHALPPWAVGAWSSIREPLADVLKHHTGVFLSALALPTVGAPLAAGDLLGGVPHLCLELARRGVLGEQGLWWGAPVGRLVSPALGADRRFQPPLVGVLFENGLVTLRPTEEWRLVPEGEARAWPLTHGGWLLGADTNPLAMVEAHPDKQGNALSFGDAPVDAWLLAVNAARARVHEVVPDLGEEHANVLVGVVPVGTHAEVSYSASYQEAPGLVYLSLHPISVTLSEALIHEVQHSKLNLLSWTDPVLENHGELYRSPVRPDPRPLWGVMLAVHAFLPVARMHRAMLDLGREDADPQRYREVCQVNHEGMEVLRAAAKPTALGAPILAGMDALEAALWAEAAAGA
jgi:HEXXH motif-containing protein